MFSRAVFSECFHSLGVILVRKLNKPNKQTKPSKKTKFFVHLFYFVCVFVSWIRHLPILGTMADFCLLNSPSAHFRDSGWFRNYILLCFTSPLQKRECCNTLFWFSLKLHLHVPTIHVWPMGFFNFSFWRNVGFVRSAVEITCMSKLCVFCLNLVVPW